MATGDCGTNTWTNDDAIVKTDTGAAGQIEETGIIVDGSNNMQFPEGAD